MLVAGGQSGSTAMASSRLLRRRRRLAIFSISDDLATIVKDIFGAFVKGLMPASLTQGVDARRARLRPMWEMTPAQRVAAMYRGELTIEQTLAWAARHPDQVPAVNGDPIMRGEFAFIAVTTRRRASHAPPVTARSTTAATGRSSSTPTRGTRRSGSCTGSDDLVPACPASGLTLAKARQILTNPKAVA